MVQTDTNFAAQEGRGREAVAPTQITLKGWFDVLWRVYRSIASDRVLLTSAGVSFYMIFALVPTLTAIVSIYGLFNDRSSILQQMDLLAGLVPASTLELINEQLTRLAAEDTSTLGLTLLISLSLALWSASAGIKAMFQAMNVAYKEQENRSFIKFNGTALLFTLGGAVASLLVVAVALVMPVVISFFPGADELEWVIRVVAYGAMVLVLLGGLSALYRWGPSRENAKWRWVTPGSLLAVVALGATSLLFSWYASNFADYNATYGSLGAAIGLMIWLWLSVTVIIIGAEVNSEIEHQTARDTTTGEDKPIGARGAYMADRVGRVWPLDRDKVETSKKTGPPKKKFSSSALALLLPATLLSHLISRDDTKR